MERKQGNRLIRFRLRTLLVFVTIASLVAAYLAWHKEQRNKERKAVAWLKQQGGNAIFHSYFSAERRWLENQADKWLGEQVRSIELRKSKSSDLSALRDLKNLRCIALSFSEVSDIAPLAELFELDEIYLEGTNVEDISPLKDLEKLEMLWLDGTLVRDLSPLYGLHGLKWLKVRDTLLTKQDIENLQRELPNCDIVYSARKTD